MRQIYHLPRPPFLFAILLLLIASCQKSEIASPGDSKPELVVQQFVVSMQDAAEVASFHLKEDSLTDKTARVVSGNDEI